MLFGICNKHKITIPQSKDFKEEKEGFIGSITINLFLLFILKRNFMVLSPL